MVAAISASITGAEASTSSTVSECSMVITAL